MECSKKIQITLQKIGFTHDDFIRVMKENIIKVETPDPNVEYKIENISIQESIKLEFHENEQDGIPDVSKLNIGLELPKDLQDKENNLLKESIELQFPENSQKDTLKCITKPYKINILNLDFRYKLNGYELYDLIQYFFSEEYGKNVYPEPYYISNVVAGYTCYESSQILGIDFKNALLQKLKSLKIFSKFLK